VQEPENSCTQGVFRVSQPWKDFHGLVLWIQVTPDRQRPRGTAQSDAYPWQRRRSKDCASNGARALRKTIRDKGYISKKLCEELLRTFNVQLITGVRSNMQNKLVPLMDKLLLRKRAVETIIDQLKNVSQIEHSRHRSPINFLVNLLCGLIAYCHQPKKPSLGLDSLPALIA
jgi:hypothetical protein